DVVARPTVQVVEPAAAGDRVRRAVAEEMVRKRGPGQVLEVLGLDQLNGRPRAERLGPGEAQVDVNPAEEFGEVEPVHPPVGPPPRRPPRAACPPPGPSPRTGTCRCRPGRTGRRDRPRLRAGCPERSR